MAVNQLKEKSSRLFYNTLFHDHVESLSARFWHITVLLVSYNRQCRIVRS